MITFHWLPLLLCTAGRSSSSSFGGSSISSSNSSRSSSSSGCTGEGDSRHDWLVQSCTIRSTFLSSTMADGSLKYSLSNGIVTRELTVDATTKVLSTTAIMMTANVTSTNLVRFQKEKKGKKKPNKMRQVGLRLAPHITSGLRLVSSVCFDLCFEFDDVPMWN